MHNQMIEYQQRQYNVQPFVESKSTTTALFVCIKKSRDTAVNLVQNSKRKYFEGFILWQSSQLRISMPKEILQIDACAE